METYGFEQTFQPIYFLVGTWPVLIVSVLWALFLGPKFCPDQPVLPVTVKSGSGQREQEKLSPFADKAGIIIFFVTIVALIFSAQLHMKTWFIALLGALLMVVFGVLDQRAA